MKTEKYLWTGVAYENNRVVVYNSVLVVFNNKFYILLIRMKGAKNAINYRNNNRINTSSISRKWNINMIEKTLVVVGYILLGITIVLVVTKGTIL